MRTAYIYYTVRPDRADETLQVVMALMDSLQGHCSPSPRLLRRCDEAHTWMEIYEGISDWPAFIRALQQAVEASGLPARLTSIRHLECFQPHP